MRPCFPRGIGSEGGLLQQVRRSEQTSLYYHTVFVRTKKVASECSVPVPSKVILYIDIWIYV